MGNTSNKVDRIKATKIMEFFSKMNANKTKKDVDISDKAKRQKLSKSLSNIAEINDTDQYDDIYSNKRTERTNDINLKKNEPRIGYRDGPFLDNQEIYSEVTDNKATNRGNQNTVGVEHENNNIKVDRINTTKIRKNNEHCTNETRKSQEYLPKSNRKKLFLINLDKIRTFFSKIILNKTKTDVDESDVGKTQIEAKSKKQKFKKIFLQRELSKSLPAIAEINDTDQYDEIYSNKMKEKANVLIVKMNETRNFYRDRPFLGNHEIYAEVTDYKATNSGNESTIRVGYNNSNNNEEKYAIRTCWKCQYCNKVNVKSSFWCIVCRREDLIEEAIVIKIICEVDSFEQNKPKFINTKFLETIHVLQMLKLDAMFWYYLQRNFYENVIEPYDVIQALNDLTKINDIKYILQRKCPLCLDCFPLSKMHNMLYCACQFCKTCYKDWVREVIMNSSCDKLLCPSCPEMNFAKKNTSLYFLSFQEIVNSDETLRNVYYEKRMSEFIDRDANTMWCTNDRCSYGFDISNHVNDKIKCPKCNELSCKKCKNKWHENEFCDFTKQNGNQNIFQDFSHNLIDCPKCKAKFYLDKGGCLHLNCIKCKHEFCECCKNQFVREGCKEQNCLMPNSFHAHHPKYCAYFLRDLDVNELESQIQDFEKPKNSTLTLCDIEIYNKSSKASKCSKPCYKDTGLCTDHFKEYIAALIFKKNREVYYEKMVSN